MLNNRNEINNVLTVERDDEFPQLKDSVYVDHAGSALYSKTQIEAYNRELLSNLYGNPHSRSQSSRLATDAIDQIRYRILQFFNTTSEEYTVIFTSGCTGALKLVAESFTFDIKSCCHGNSVGSFSKFIKKDQDGFNAEKTDNVSKCTCKTTEVQGESSEVKVRKGTFSYLQDNHTSVQGMREIVKEKAENILCIEEAESSFKIHSLQEGQNPGHKGNNLFVYPAQSNYCGRKYPMKWIKEVHQYQMTFQGSFPGRWFVLLDAASHVSTSDLDLGVYKPDFVTLSFYKMFGFPTGLGALIVKNDSSEFLRKTYFGGGTVAVSSPTEFFHISRTSLYERFEDGTLPFLGIIALRHGFDALENIGGGMKTILQHTFAIAQFFHRNLKDLHHGNGQPVAEIYCHGGFSDPSTQGPIVNFNLIRQDGSYIGFAEVDKMAQLYNIHLRTGCFCNIGACQKYLKMSSQQIKENFEAGHVCGDDRDLINGQPTGSVRISFGYMSTITDAQHCLKFICECFVQNPSKPDFMTDVHLKCSKAMHPEEVSTNLNSKDKISAENGNKECDWLKTTSGISCISVNEQDGFCPKVSIDIILNDIIQNCSPTSHILTNICLYPVKSCGALAELLLGGRNIHSQSLPVQIGFRQIFELLAQRMGVKENSTLFGQVTEWTICDTGLLYDREWMIVSESGVTISQKREPKLCLIKPNIDLVKKQLTLSYPDMCSITLPLDSNYGVEKQSPTLPCIGKVCGDRVTGTDCGDTVGNWISCVLQKPGCRLIRQNNQDWRKCRLKESSNDEDKTSRLSLANESQYLLISRQSVQELHSKIQQNIDSPSFELENLVQRFRANLVIGGGHAFEEDMWDTVQIGRNKFMSQGGCSRCQMVCLDQQSGERSKEPLRTLAAWRGKKIPFGIHLQHDCSTVGKTIKVGDVLTVG